MELTPDQLKTYQLFFPWANIQTNELKNRGGRFVHYTSAETALSIIQNKSFWMRNARTMNDFSEVEYGKSCLMEAYAGKAGERLKALFERTHPGFYKDLETRFNAWLPDMQSHTYVACVSEHLDREDKIGRLSMWRAYGGANGVALVFNNRPFLTPSNALNAFSSPVAYFSKGKFTEEFFKLAIGIEAEEAFIRTLDYEVLMASVFIAFRFAVLCTKHPGFKEEREWRVIYSPNFMKSDHITQHVTVVRGVPQHVCQIPLKNIPDKGFEGAEIPELIDKLIIGPSDYPIAMFNAFYEALAASGIERPEERIVLSDIPIRQK